MGSFLRLLDKFLDGNIPRRRIKERHSSYDTGLLLQPPKFMALKASVAFLRSKELEIICHLLLALRLEPNNTHLPKMSSRKLSFNISTKSRIFNDSILTLLASSFFCLSHLAIPVCSVVGKWEDRSEGRTECNRSDKIF